MPEANFGAVPHPQVVHPRRGHPGHRDRAAAPTASRCARSSSPRPSTTPTPAGSAQTSTTSSHGSAELGREVRPARARRPPTGRRSRATARPAWSASTASTSTATRFSPRCSPTPSAKPSAAASPGCPPPARSRGPGATDRHPAGAQGRAVRPVALRHRLGQLRRRPRADEVVDRLRLRHPGPAARPPRRSGRRRHRGQRRTALTMTEAIKPDQPHSPSLLNGLHRALSASGATRHAPPVAAAARPAQLRPHLGHRSRRRWRATYRVIAPGLPRPRRQRLGSRRATTSPTPTSPTSSAGRPRSAWSGSRSSATPWAAPNGYVYAARHPERVAAGRRGHRPGSSTHRRGRSGSGAR